MQSLNEIADMAIRIKPRFTKQATFAVSAKRTAEHAANNKGNRNPLPLSSTGIDPDFLPAEIQTALRTALKRSKLTPDQQLKMVEYANHLAQFPDQPVAAVGTQRDAIAEVAKAAHALLNQLNGLSEAASATLSLHAHEARVMSPRSYSIETREKMIALEFPGLLNEAWEWVQALEAAAEYAHEQLKPSKQDKVTEDEARCMVANLALFHFRMTGKRPPKDNASWFGTFARTFGTYMRVHFEDENLRKIKGKPFVGAGILASGIEQAFLPESAWASPEEIAALAASRVAATARAAEFRCIHLWPLPLYPPAPQNCAKCGAGINGSPDR